MAHSKNREEPAPGNRQKEDVFSQSEITARCSPVRGRGWRNQKRPDQQFYVPGARRKQNVKGNSKEKNNDFEKESVNSSVTKRDINGMACKDEVNSTCENKPVSAGIANKSSDGLIGESNDPKHVSQQCIQEDEAVDDSCLKLDTNSSTSDCYLNTKMDSCHSIATTLTDVVSTGVSQDSEADKGTDKLFANKDGDEEEQTLCDDVGGHIDETTNSIETIVDDSLDCSETDNGTTKLFANKDGDEEEHCQTLCDDVGGHKDETTNTIVTIADDSLDCSETDNGKTKLFANKDGDKEEQKLCDDVGGHMDETTNTIETIVDDSLDCSETDNGKTNLFANKDGNEEEETCDDVGGHMDETTNTIETIVDDSLDCSETDNGTTKLFANKDGDEEEETLCDDVGGHMDETTNTFVTNADDSLDCSETDMETTKLFANKDGDEEEETLCDDVGGHMDDTDDNHSETSETIMTSVDDSLDCSYDQSISNKNDIGEIESMAEQMKCDKTESPCDTKDEIVNSNTNIMNLLTIHSDIDGTKQCSHQSQLSTITPQVNGDSQSKNDPTEVENGMGQMEVISCFNRTQENDTEDDTTGDSGNCASNTESIDLLDMSKEIIALGDTKEMPSGDNTCEQESDSVTTKLKEELPQKLEKPKKKSKKPKNSESKEEKKKVKKEPHETNELDDNASKDEKLIKTKSKKKKEKRKPKEKDAKCSNSGNDKGLDDCCTDDGDSWFTKYNDDGDCLDPELMKELSKVTGITKPTKHKTQFDFYSLPEKEVQLDEGYGHIVEIYDFSSDLKTQDLTKALSVFKDQGYDLQWVDDTHALAVFSGSLAANQAIQICSSPLLKLRPISHGIAESKKKARQCLEFLQPQKPRPQTTPLAANRLVARALGVKSSMTKEESQKEREKLKEARELKKQKKQRKADVWGE